MPGSAEPGVLATARYGKDKVRVFRVVRDPESKVHNVVEYNVTVLLEGAFEARYADYRRGSIHVLIRYRGLNTATLKRTTLSSSRPTRVRTLCDEFYSNDS